MFKIATLVALTIVLPWASGSRYCDYVHTLDCFHIPDTHAVCGTDGVTYRNHCSLATAYCQHLNVHKANDGQCQPAITTPAPVNGSEIAFDIFCIDVAYFDCPVNGVKICASNGMEYVNICEFDKARCSHRQLTEVTCHITIG